MGGLFLRKRGLRVLALSCALAGLPASGALAAPLYPDLVADPPGTALAPVVYDDGAGPRLLMRFDGFVHNAGLGALEIFAMGRSGTTMTNVQQRVYDTASGPTPLTSPAQVLYETDDAHDHWHLKNIARYSLWNQEGTAEVAPAQKVGFCLVDLQRMETTGPTSPAYSTAANNFCGQRQPGVSSVLMGVSAGWRDIYSRNLAFQWIDVSDVAPGSYRLKSEIDPEGRIRESNEVNPAAFGAGAAVVPGYRAANVGVPLADGPRPVQLAAANVGGLTQPPQFKIVTAPQHGSLDQPVGQWFDATSVQYTPATPYPRADSFTFAARNPGSAFPRNPPAAVATVEGLGALVSISGAPRRLRAGDAARLKAVVQNDSPKVSWSVGGVTGGSKIRGRITAKGLYRAPKKVPPGGRVRVSATSASGVSGHAVIRILKARGRRAAPDVPGDVLGRRDSSNPLSRLGFARHGKRLLVSLRSAKAGVVVVAARKEAVDLGRCRARVVARQRMTCAISLDELGPSAAFVCRIPQTSRLRLPRVRVSATLYVKGKKRAVRRAWVKNS